MRTLAAALLILAAVVYALTLETDGAWGFVNAAAEAAMVGAMADWFAVTALFRHPLGIPVPHTALIPNRKDELARSLEEFVGSNFLSEEVVRGHVSRAGIPLRLGGWLRTPANSERVVREASAALRAALSGLRDDDVEALVRDVLIPRIAEEPLSPVAGQLLTEILSEKAHHGLIDLGLDEMHRWLRTNQDVVARILGERAPWWSPQWLDDRVINRLQIELVSWVADIRDDPDHRVRAALDRVLEQLAHDLQHDADVIARAERLKERVLGQPRVVDTAVSLWNALRRALIDALDEPEGMLRKRGVEELTRFGVRLESEPEFRERFDGYVEEAAAYVVNRYGAEITTVISETVNRWDGKDTANRIELFVGRDLQFIRINGTVVGGLVGLVIHTITVLV